MKNLFQRVLIAAVMALCAVAGAQTYPYTNPVFTPNAVGPTSTYAAPAQYAFTTIGVGTVSVRVSGTCTSLAAVMQGSNDGTTFTNINLYPIATGTSAPVAVASISAAGFWKANAAGYANVRLNITALTATCNVTMVGSPHGFNGVSF